MAISYQELARLCYQFENRKHSEQEVRRIAQSPISDQKIKSAARRYLNGQISADQLPREFYS